MLLNNIRKVDATSLFLDECMEYLALLDILEHCYSTHGVEQPKALASQRKSFERRLRDLLHDQREHELAKIDAELALLQTPDEKRAKLLERKAALEASLSPTAG